MASGFVTVLLSGCSEGGKAKALLSMVTAAATAAKAAESCQAKVDPFARCQQPSWTLAACSICSPDVTALVRMSTRVNFSSAKVA
jgi:hypothetical protein